MFDYFDITTIVSGLTVVGIPMLLGWFFRDWLWGLVKKDKPNTEPTFTPDQVKIITDQARASAVEEIKKASKASGLESNKPKTIDPAQKEILFDELNKLEQGLTEFKKLLQDM